MRKKKPSRVGFFFGLENSVTKSRRDERGEVEQGKASIENEGLISESKGVASPIGLESTSLSCSGSEEEKDDGAAAKGTRKPTETDGGESLP